MKTDNNITAKPRAVLMTETYKTGRAYPLTCDLDEINRDAMNRSGFIEITLLKYVKYILVMVSLLVLIHKANAQKGVDYSNTVNTGADQIGQWVGELKGKAVGLCVNQTSILKNNTHLLDTLLALGINVKRVFTPEHGLRGKAEAGEKVASSIDKKTGLTIVSLYGKNKKPAEKDIVDLDIVIFDLQDVGARFYTYISTLHYLMEVCAESKKQVWILDRPNPNGFYVDGPVLDTSLRSFVGMHPVPIVHGMTIGEYGQMINGEGWLKGNSVCSLNVIKCKEYTHKTLYKLPVSPSPNLTSMHAVFLYTTTCLFEGTSISVGRGTNYPFRNIGQPGFKEGVNYFTPKSVPAAKDPQYKGQKCRGIFISDDYVLQFFRKPQIQLDLLLYCYKFCADKEKFFTEKGSFTILCGDRRLAEQIKSGMSADEIRMSWEPGLKRFKETRKKYLLYPDYE